MDFVHFAAFLKQQQLKYFVINKIVRKYGYFHVPAFTADNDRSHDEDQRRSDQEQNSKYRKYSHNLQPVEDHRGSGMA